MKHVITALLCLSTLACGGGSGSSDTATSPSPPQPPVADTPPPYSAYQQAAAILDTTTFGPTFSEIESVVDSGPAAWLDAQFSQPISRHEPIVRRYIAEYGDSRDGPIPPALYRRFAYFEQALTAPDQLRQLVAYALSQIFVVSETGMLFTNPLALSSYYDMLLEHSFGNYRDLLRAVTLHPAMGFYLSHVNNSKTDPVAQTFPDENYAREVMQLFSIGLYELNADGTQVMDADGRAIDTYNNDDIREFSKIFTGLTYDVDNGQPRFGRNRGALHLPMVMFDEYHEPGEKRLLRGVVVPAGQTGLQDIDAAIDNLFQHPNVGPFIGRQLIQRLVHSNPSPDYVGRVSAVFADNGAGVRGDMEAVIRAVLTDIEATAATRVREPFRRYVAALRSLEARPEVGNNFGIVGRSVESLTGQLVMAAPSVFNFYSPFYRPPNAQGLVSPEMQITTENTAVGFTNLMAQLTLADSPIETYRGLPEMTIDLSGFLAESEASEALMDRMELLFFGGRMAPATRAVLMDFSNELSVLPPEERIPALLYSALISPDQAVTRGEAE